MSEGAPKRRLRIRRKQSLGSDVASEGATQLGCCLFDVVVTASIFIGLLALPTYLML